MVADAGRTHSQRQILGSRAAATESVKSGDRYLRLHTEHTAQHRATHNPRRDVSTALHQMEHSFSRTLCTITTTYHAECHTALHPSCASPLDSNHAFSQQSSIVMVSALASFLSSHPSQPYSPTQPNSTRLLLSSCSSLPQSEVEATLDRIKSHPGVEGVIIGQWALRLPTVSSCADVDSADRPPPSLPLLSSCAACSECGWHTHQAFQGHGRRADAQVQRQRRSARGQGALCYQGPRPAGPSLALHAHTQQPLPHSPARTATTPSSSVLRR